MLPPGPWAAFLPRPPGRSLHGTCASLPFPPPLKVMERARSQVLLTPALGSVQKFLTAPGLVTRRSTCRAEHHWGVTCTPALPEGEENTGKVALIISSPLEKFRFPRWH